MNWIDHNLIGIFVGYVIGTLVRTTASKNKVEVYLEAILVSLWFVVFMLIKIYLS